MMDWLCVSIMRSISPLRAIHLIKNPMITRYRYTRYGILPIKVIDK